MKKRFINYFVFCVFVFLLFFCVGCSDSVENNDGTGYVTFTEKNSSRSLHTGGESAVDPENLVWAYVAVKKDGLHTVGASEVATSATAGKTEVVDGINYVLKPVKEDFSKGLNIEVGPFSWGEWKFVLYAYGKCVSGVFTNLVYTASTLETFTTLNPLASGKTSVPVLLKFVNGTGYPSTGTMKLGDISLIVPQGMKFYSGKTVEVSFTDTASPAIAAFTGMATLSADAEAGTEIPLTFATTQFNNVAVGAHILEIEVKYDGTQITTAGAFTYTVLVKDGDVVTLYGDVTDLKMTSGSDTNTVFSTAVCRLGDVEYDSLVEALAATTSSNNTIHLLRNVDYGGVATGFVGTSGTVKIILDGYYLKNLTIPHTLLTASETSKMIEFVPDEASISGATVRLAFGAIKAYSGDFDAVIDFLYEQSDGTNLNLWIKCTNGYLNAGGLTAGNSYIYGRLNYLNIGARKDVANNLGAHIYCDVDGHADSAVGLYKGYFEFGDNIHISRLAYSSTCTPADSIVVGKPTTVIDNVPAKAGVIRQITLNGNGATAISGVSTTLYAVEGTRVTIPKVEEVFAGREGWVNKWNTKNDGTGYDIESAGQSVVVKNDTTLYATCNLNCLCFTAKVAGATIGMAKRNTAPSVTNLKYSKDGATWTSFTPGSTTVTLANVGDKVYFKGNQVLGASGGHWYFTATQEIDASGSVMSLVDGNGSTTNLSGKNYAFYGLFYACDKLKTIPDLPATVLSTGCYQEMFNDCDGLTNLGNVLLKAEEVPAYAYCNIFRYCRSMTNAPIILAKRVTGNSALYCTFYGCSKLVSMQDEMFIVKGEADKSIRDTFRGFLNGCTELVKPPAFYGVTVLGPCDFMDAFPGSSKINSIRVGFIDWGTLSSSEGCTFRWVRDVAASGTFTCPAALNTTTKDENHVPAGWTVVNI